LDNSIFHNPLILAAVKIPVIVVFTKYDLLVVEHLQACKSLPNRKAEALKRAKNAFSGVTNNLNVPFVAVSLKKQFISL
jgi:GTPase